MSRPSPERCATCPAHNLANLVKLGVDMTDWDYVVALAGNPNTGKSTVFNALTGLRQHTGNWPGKTVARAEGGFAYGGARYKLVDLPGTYSLLSTSVDEEIARDFILFGQPDVTVVVVDATPPGAQSEPGAAGAGDHRPGRGLPEPDGRGPAARPHASTSAGWRATSACRSCPRRRATARGSTELHRGDRRGGHRARGRAGRAASATEVAALQRAVEPARRRARRGVFPALPNARWVALRLLDGDERIVEAVRERRAGRAAARGRCRGPDADRLDGAQTVRAEPARPGGRGLAGRAPRELRWQVGPDFHQSLVEAIYTEAARHRRPRRDAPEGERRAFDLDRAIDRLVTSRWFGFPLMLLLLTAVFWLTIAGANVPSPLLATLLLDTVHPALKSARRRDRRSRGGSTGC